MTDIQELTKRVDELSSKEAIRECIYRVDRGVDRIDVELLRSAFHSDAQVQWMAPASVPVNDWLTAFREVQTRTQRAQHLIGNVLIELNGDTANVESYEVARHLTNMGEEWKDLVYSARYLDTFTRRDGEWKIQTRVKIMDWVRILEGSDGAYDHAPAKGSRDAEDISYRMFGAKVFGGEAGS